MEQLRKQYSQEDKELIEKFIEERKSFNLKSESLAQELEDKGQPGKLSMTDFLPSSLSLSLSLSLSPLLSLSTFLTAFCMYG